VSAPGPDDVAPIDDWNQLLRDRVAVITGGGDGIGGAISTLFAQHGALVEMVEIDTERAERTRRSIEEAGGRVHVQIADVTDPSAVERMAADVLGRHGRVDVLINNVGDYRPLVRFEASTPESWNDMYTVNLFHVFAVTRAFLGSMRERGSGSIVNIHSVEGLRGYPGDPVYAAMKAAVAHFTTSLAVSVGRYGVRVNGIGPDLTQSPQVDYLTGFEDHEELWSSWAPVGRLAWPEDQARVALFLASDQSGFVTGHNVPVDGGTKAGGGWFYSPSARRFVNRPKTL
jgi:NAD(P)-dependent dehydrogenase (short-subunit alcohol dehydrogenase family)